MEIPCLENRHPNKAFQLWRSRDLAWLLAKYYSIQEPLK